MKNNHQLALIVAYYLSRGDKNAYRNLGFQTFSEAAKGIGKILDVKSSTVKNMRDEFDPYHENKRVGWLRELRGSRLKVLKSFQETDDNALLEIVKGILFDKDFQGSTEFTDIENLFAENAKDNYRQEVFILRGPTGKKAELFFIKYFNEHKMPVNGELIDKRDQGCGYDFEIITKTDNAFVEVKGLATASGGVLFTNKEWQTAIEAKGKFYLALVRNLSDQPEIKFIQNPASSLKAKKNIYTTVQLNWTVSGKELA